jgi:fructokinase
MPLSAARPVAGVELGGSKCICLLASGPDDIRRELRTATLGPVKTLAAIEAVLTEWHAEENLRALGLASFGPLDLDPASAEFGSIVGTPKSGWDRVALLSWAQRFAVPVALDTDVNAAALAEGMWGSAQGLKSWVYVTVGTGIGVGSIVDGKAVRGLGHSEAGHLRVPRLPESRLPGNCPFHGDCVEGLASAPAVQARAGLPIEEIPDDHPVWAEVAHALTSLFHNLILTVVPERIVVGGGIVLGRPQLLPRIRSMLCASLGNYAHGSRIAHHIQEFLVLPALGERAGPLGAIALAQRALRSAGAPRNER